MSPRTAEEGHPAPAVAQKGISNRQLVVLTLPAVVLVVFVLVLLYLLYQPLVFFAVLGLVPPDAVQVSAAADGRTLASHRIGDARTVADLYARINRLPLIVRGGNCGLGPSDQVTYTYTFRFTRGRALIEVVTTAANEGCVPWWEIERGGWGETHGDLTGATTAAILAEAQLPPPRSQS